MDNFLVIGYFVLGTVLGFVIYRWIAKNHKRNDFKHTSLLNKR